MLGRLFSLLVVAVSSLAITSARAQEAEVADEQPPTATAESATTSQPAATATTDSATDERNTADPTGTWKWERQFNGNTVEFELRLKWDGKSLSGEYTAFDNTSSIKDGTLEGDQLSFAVDREFNGNKFEVLFDGKVLEDAIDGTIELDFGGGAQEFDWHATRHVDVEDVLGTWQLALETPNGDVLEPKITLTKEQDKLAGTYESVFGQREAKNVALEAATLTWEISGENNGNTFKLVYSGKVRGNKIAGTNTFDFGGNTGTWEFTGERVETPNGEPEQASAEAEVQE